MIKILFIIIFIFNISSAYANTCGNKELASWSGPESRTKCSKYAKGDFSFGGGWKTCVNWKNDMKKHEISIYSTCPDKPDKETIKSIGFCITKSINTILPNVAFKEGSYYLLNEKSNDINIAFKGCMLERGIKDEALENYNIEIINKSYW